MKIQPLLASLTLSFFLIFFPWAIQTHDGHALAVDHLLPEILSIIVLVTLLTIPVYYLFKNFKTEKIKIFSSFFIYILSVFFLRGILKSLQTSHLISAMNDKNCLVIWGILAFILFAFYIWKREKSIETTTTLFSILFPLVLFNFANTSMRLYKIQESYPALSLSKKSHPRIFWLIFDELDQYFLFTNRPRNIDLSAFDAIKKQSFYAFQAIEPNVETRVSIASLLTGKFVEKASYKLSDYTLHFNDGTPSQLLSQSQTLFDVALKNQFNTAILGWELHYDRIFNKKYCFCSTSPFNETKVKHSEWKSLFFPALSAQIRRDLGFYIKRFYEEAFNKSFLPRIMDALEVYQIQSTPEKYLFNFSHQLNSILDNSSLNFCFFHFPFPHYPTVFNRKSKQIEADLPYSYASNLELSNRFLALIKNRLEKGGEWDSSWVIITSDHWLRNNWKRDYRIKEENEEFHAIFKKKKELGKHYVPFIIKFPNQKEGIEYPNEFNALVLHKIVDKILENPDFSPDELKRILECFSTSDAHI